jgi:hypothetical protein
MGFLPILYAGLFFFIALCGYVCLSVVADLRALGVKVFVAVLAFGASSYIGFITIVIAVGSSPLKALLQGQFHIATYVLAYVGPGLTGSYLSLRALRASRPPQPQK